MATKELGKCPDGWISEIEGASRWMLEPDWDGEGSPGASKNAWRRAVRFAKNIGERSKSKLPLPRLGPGPEESVDAHWKDRDMDLLVNFPAKGKASFYGDQGPGSQGFSGALDPEDKIDVVLGWLSRLPKEGDYSKPQKAARLTVEGDNPLDYRLMFSYNQGHANLP